MRRIVDVFAVYERDVIRSRTRAVIAGELAAAGVPLRRIGAELERAGHRPRGRAWHLTTVARLVRRAQAGL